MNGKITYHQQVTYCGKPRCRKCRDGIGHGPYWYAYKTADGQTTRSYIGKNLPPDVQAALEAVPVSNGESAMSPNVSSPPDPNPDGTVMHIWTLGQFRIERRQHQQWQTVTDSAWQQHPVRSLLGYLLCSPERRANRSQIISELWPTLDRETATNRLNKTLQNLRKVLGHPSIEAGQAAEETLRIGSLPLLADGEWLSLAGQSQLWIDADVFEERAAAFLATDLPPSSRSLPDDPLERERLLRETVALYIGTFLPEEQDSEWAGSRRQMLRRNWTSLLLQLVDLYTARGADPAAIEVLDRVLANDPTNEPAVQRLIVILARLKRRGEALRAYKSFVEVLQREYAATPFPETSALYEAVRQGRELPTHILSSPLDASGVPAEPAMRSRSGPLRSAPETFGRVHQSPLVGRALELQAMRAILLDVEQGMHLQLASSRKISGIPLDTQRRPQCMLLMGEAGIGKTRLAEEIGREAQQRGWLVAWSHLYPQERNVPYRLWIESLRKMLNVGMGLRPSLDPLLLQPLLALLPELREIIPQSVLEQSPSPYALTPEQEQLRLWEAIADLLKAVSESSSLLIVLDDIQWADSSSHDLLGYLARHLHGYPIVFLGTFREAELPRHPPHPLLKLIFHMQREHTIKTINVEPLTAEQIGLLVSRVSPQPEAAKLKHIQERAAGNPFFAEELARSTPPTLPMTVTAALENRISNLSKPCRQLLATAAVLGGSFEFPVICSMESGNEVADEDVVLDLLDEALRSGVLNDEGTGTRISYHFWHPLLVSHLYDALSAIRRARLHQRAADVLQRLHHGREEEVAATITYHLVKSGADPVQIAYHAELAGNRAYAVAAYSEARQHYSLAVEHLLVQQDPTEQAHRVSLLERLAECTVIRGQFTDARHLYESVLELRRQLHGPATDAHYEAQVQALLLGEIGLTWLYTGDQNMVIQAFERSEHVLRAADIVGGPAWARLYYLQSKLCSAEGNYEEALRLAQEALKLFTQQQMRPLAGKAATQSPQTAHGTRIQRTLEGNPVNLASTYRHIATIAVSMGQLTLALSYQNQALALYEQYNEVRQIAHVLCDMNYTHLMKAEYELAQAELRRSQKLAERIGDDPLLSIVYSDWGKLAAANDELEEAEHWYGRALDMAEELTKDSAYISRWNAELAAVLQAAGNFAEATRCIKKAWSTGRAIRNNPCIGLALVTLGNIRIVQALAARDLPSLYERLLRHARMNIQRALALDELDVETRISGQLAFAHISFLLGDIEQAHEQLQQVILEARRYEQTLLILRAQQLLEQIG